MFYIKKLHKDAVLPTRAHPTDSGLDVCSVQNLMIMPGERAIVDTGIAYSIEPGFELQLRCRSGQAAKKGLMMVNGIGTLDHSYRGSIKAILYNSGSSPIEISKGDKIAQLVKCPVSLEDPLEVDELFETDRGANGLGSTDNNS